MIINGLCFLALNSPGIGEHLFAYAALYPPGSQFGTFQPWQLITYMFLHGGFMHIFFNLFVLWMFGQQIEHLWGTKRFVIYYFLTGIGAGILHLSLAAGGGVPTVGASGAVFGVLLAFGMMFPNREIMLIFLPIPIKAKYFVIMIGAFELFAGVSGLQTGIAHFAHLGGLVVGYILIRLWGIKGGYS